MKKYVFGLTTQQWSILGILFCAINIGLILHYFVKWNPEKVHRIFLEDSILYFSQTHSVTNDSVLKGIQIIRRLKNKSSVSSPAVDTNHKAKKNSSIININQASMEQLVLLPGIGPATARKIILYRKKHGSFKRIDDLINIKGIGSKKLAQLKPYLRIGDK